MTENHLLKIIENFNTQKFSENEVVFVKKLSESVDFALIWDELPNDNNEISNWTPDEYFLIKNGKQFVGVVYDMTSDLHWYLKEEFRKKGLLSKNLNEIIIPYLFRNRNKQRITIDKTQIGEENYNNSLNVAQRAGFIKKNEKEFILENNESFFNKFLEISNNEIPPKMDIERMYEIRKKLFYVSKYILLIQNELEMHNFMIDYTDDLKNLSERIKKEVWEFEHQWHCLNERNACR